jgi:hypothetical protein
MTLPRLASKWRENMLRKIGQRHGAASAIIQITGIIQITARDVVILTLRTLQFSRLAMLSVLAVASDVAHQAN